MTMFTVKDWDAGKQHLKQQAVKDR